MNWKDWMEILQSVSIIIASLVAIFGIDAWRREFVGKRQMELAEEVLALFYEARDIIHWMRSPLGFAGEGASRQAEDGETPVEKRARDRAYVAIERYNRHKDMFSKLHSLRYRFLAQFGTEVLKPFEELDKIVNEIFASARRLSQEWARESLLQQNDATLEARQEHIRELETIFWEILSEKDPINPRLDGLIAEIDATCKAIILSKGTLFGLINLPLWKRFKG